MDTTTDTRPLGLNVKVWTSTCILEVFVAAQVFPDQEQWLAIPDSLISKSETRVTKEKETRTVSLTVRPKVSENKTRPFSPNFKNDFPMGSGTQSGWSLNSSSSVCSYPNVRNFSTSPHMVSSKLSISEPSSVVRDTSSERGAVKTILRMCLDVIDEMTVHCGSFGNTV